LVVANNVQPSPLATILVDGGNLIVTPIDPNGGELQVQWQITDYQGTLLLEGTRRILISKIKTNMNSTYLGKRGELFLFAQSHGGLNFVVERLSMSPSPDKFFPRGSNILNNSDVVLIATPPTIVDSPTNYDGRVVPASFPTTVAGYVKGTEADGAVFFIMSDVLPPDPLPVVGTLMDGETVGNADGMAVKTLKIGSGFYLCEIKSASPFAYFPRGKNFASNSAFTATKTIATAELAGAETGYGGRAIPSGCTPPIGFMQKTTNDGSVYFEAIGDVQPPIDQVLNDNEAVGNHNGNIVRTIKIGTGFYLCEMKSSTPVAYFVRGRNFLNNSGVSFSKEMSVSQLAGEDTGYGGLSKPSAVTPPTGFVSKTTADGAVYFEQSGTATPRALVSGEVVATRALSATSIKNLTTKLYGNDFYILEERTTSPESFFVRGKNIVSNSTVTLSKEVDISLLAGDVTTYDGLTLPPTFATPTGYTKKTETDGAIYFEKDTVVIAPVVPTLSLPVFTQQTDPTPVKEDSFFKKNMMWIIPVAIVGAIGIGIGIYQLFKS
jgi:hypothetical protein